MQIQLGYELIYECSQPTPMILTLNIHFTRVSDLVIVDHIITSPPSQISGYRDSFGNWCSRIVAPPGDLRISTDALINDSGRPDAVGHFATTQCAVEKLPTDTLVYLLGSRYCETDRLSEVAWALFGQTPPGWPRVQAICDFVHGHLTFGYEHARVTKTALEAFNERRGVCRDYTHLAVTLCRCMNIPARYCTGYLGDIGMAKIAAHEAELLGYLSASLDAIEGIRLVGTAANKAGVQSFLLDDIHPHDLGTILDHEGVAIRTGHHCAMPVMEHFGVPGTARASLGLYNTREDVDRLVNALETARKLFA